jgi:hypothetical protein
MEMVTRELDVSYTEKELSLSRWPQIIRATLHLWLSFEENSLLLSRFEGVMAETGTSQVRYYCP